MNTVKTAREIFESGLINVIPADKTVPSGTYSASFRINQDHQSGQVESLTLYTSHTGSSGRILALTGQVLFFDEDPQITGSMAGIPWAARQTVVGQVPIAEADWTEDEFGASISKHLPGLMSFHMMNDLYGVFRNQGPENVNSGTTQNEILNINVWRARCEGT